MLGGGLEPGTSTLITGNSGTGKTTLSMTVVTRAAALGLRSIVYTFDEGAAEMVDRADAVGLPIRSYVDAGLISIRRVNPLLLYPDEFAAWIRAEVEGLGTRVVVIDSVNGYSQSMPDERHLGGHMHQLIGYLNRMGVTTLLVNEVSDLIGRFVLTQFGISYMADNVIILRYYEYEGSIHKAIGVLKKRLSGHEKSLRSFAVTGNGVVVGDDLPMLRGILRGEAWPNGSAGPRGDSDG